MRLADLIDLEWLLRDGEPDVGDPRSLREMLAKRGVPEPEVRRRLDGERGLRAAICTSWLATLRSQGAKLPGARFERVQWIVGWILIGAGLVFGGLTTEVLLAYDGSRPVNVLYFIFLAIAPQILLLLVTIWIVLFTGRTRQVSGIGPVQRSVAWLFAKFMGRGAAELNDGMAELRARRALYAVAERWTVFGLTQRFGVAFNVGALVWALVLITTSDLVFSWATTLSWTPEQVHGVVEIIAAPWSWLVPDACPGVDVIAASRWDRMIGGFVGGQTLEQALELSAQWWRFLVAGLIVYGLLPRLLALGIGILNVHRAIRRAGLDHAGFQRLYDRLFPSTVGWAGPDPSQVRGDDPSLGGGALGAGRLSAPPGAPTWVIAWGRLAERSTEVAALVQRRFGAELRAELSAGGRDLQDDRRSLERLRADRAGRVVLVCEAGQQPSKDVLGFVADIRSAIGDQRPLVVSLIEDRGDDGSGAEGSGDEGVGADNFGDAEPDEYEAWRRALLALGDAHLWLEGLEGVE